MSVSPPHPFDDYDWSFRDHPKPDGELSAGLEKTQSDFNRFEPDFISMVMGSRIVIIVINRGFQYIITTWIVRLLPAIRIRLSKNHSRHGNVPKLGEYWLYLILPSKARKYLPADLEEEFKTEILPRFGFRKARLWYWTQVFKSIGPIIARRLAKLASLAWLLKSAQSILRRILS